MTLSLSNGHCLLVIDRRAKDGGSVRMRQTVRKINHEAAQAVGNVALARMGL